MAKRKVWWQNQNYVDVYELARAGMKDGQIAKALGVTLSDFRWQCERDDAVVDALARGRRSKDSDGKEMQSYKDYIHDHLPKRAREVWSELTAADDEKDLNRQQQAMLLLQEGGTRMKQQLFVHALFSYFNVSDACRMVGVGRNTVEAWARNDAGFAELVATLHEHKKDFLDGAFWRLVKEGNEKAIIHGQQTFNRDRGYGKVTDVNMSAQVNTTISHQLFNLDDHLHKLSAACVAELLRVMEQADSPPQVIDAVAKSLPAPDDSPAKGVDHVGTGAVVVQSGGRDGLLNDGTNAGIAERTAGGDDPGEQCPDSPYAAADGPDNQQSDREHGHVTPADGSTEDDTDDV